MRRFLLLGLTLLTTGLPIGAQTTFSEPTTLFLLHSSGNHLKRGSDQGGYLEAPSASRPQQMTIIPDGQGYYSIQAAGSNLFLAKVGSWNTAFVEDSTLATSKFSIEQVNKAYIRLRCKENNRYLGTDSNSPDAKVFSDKNGSDLKHYWYFSDQVNATVSIDTLAYGIAPSLVRQVFEGWGVSLCWWANMCGNWTDKKIDEIVRWMVSPTGLNYSHFRYNIGGGDDPENRNCTLHHMGSGKGLRAEMEGFKDFSGDEYHWERDAAQRKIMLKIKELRPDADFEAFSNSCPYYMTYSGCVSGNTDGGKDNLKPEYYEEFAHYLVDVCKHYKEEYDIEFRTLEPFNESVTNFWFANGVQEGCHFDYNSQIAFLRVLDPILQASGLSTVISASDETNVGLSVEGLRKYSAAGVLSKVGQWNTHTYSGSIADRAHLAFLAHQAEIPLWMSEVGAGGSGIAGNLNLAQKLIDDMRYLQPLTWIDWQYIEEPNDQWCTVRGNFAAQTYAKVKNYYVRQHFSRFIPQGSRIITSLNNQSLAALNARQDTLVLVVLNTGTKAVHRIDLSQFTDIAPAAQIRAFRTSESEDLARVRNFTLNGDQLTLNLNDLSITTLLIPCRPRSTSAELRTDCEYLIIPRHETTRALTATTAGKITLQDIQPGTEGQRWHLVSDGEGYLIEDEQGRRLTSHRSANSSSLNAQTAATREQTFNLQPVDFPYYRISPSSYSRYAFDLSNASTNVGTTICTWDYDTNDIPTHRQWMLFPLTSPQTDDVRMPASDSVPSPVLPDGIYDLSGRCLLRAASHIPSSFPSGIYLIRRQGCITKVRIN